MPVTLTPAVTTASTANATSYASGAFTPAVGDILLAIVTASATVIATPTMTNSAGLTMTRQAISTNIPQAGGGDLALFASTAGAAASSQTVTFDCTGDAATGCVIMVFRLSGYGATVPPWASLVRQSGSNSDVAAVTPSATLANPFLTTSAGLGFISNLSNPAGLTPATGWTESTSPLGDTGFGSPTWGLQAMYRNQGETGSTITWGGASATSWSNYVFEFFDARSLTRSRVPLQFLSRKRFR